MNALRSNWQNTGREFEKELELVLQIYERKNIARIRKVSPPTRTIGGHPPRVIYLENPFLDFAGVFTAAAGRAIFFEAKTTKTERLPLGSGGLIDKQAAALLLWSRAGAVSFLLWRVGRTVRVFGPSAPSNALSDGRKHLRFEDGAIVMTDESGLPDFLPVVARVVGF